MTDRAVQPEAPTTEAGRALVRFMEVLRQRTALQPREMAALRASLRAYRRAIEAEARAASQETVPESYRRGWRDAMAESQRLAASQERPSIDRDVVFGAILTLEPRLAGVYTIEDAARFADALAASLARLAGGSVASPEPTE